MKENPTLTPLQGSPPWLRNASTGISLRPVLTAKVSVSTWATGHPALWGISALDAPLSVTQGSWCLVPTHAGSLLHYSARPSRRITLQWPPVGAGSGTSPSSAAFPSMSPDFLSSSITGFSFTSQINYLHSNPCSGSAAGDPKLRHPLKVGRDVVLGFDNTIFVV